MENPIKEAITKYLEMEIPYKWEEAPAWARRSYYQNYPDSKCNEKNLQHFYNGATMQQEFYLVDSVLTADILEAVFDKQAKDLLNGRSDAETKKIALIISSIPGWERKQLPKEINDEDFTISQMPMKIKIELESTKVTGSNGSVTPSRY